MRQERTDLVVVPGPVHPNPLSARSLGFLDLGRSLLGRAFLHAVSGQVNSKVFLGFVALQAVDNGMISGP